MTTFQIGAGGDDGEASKTTSVTYPPNTSTNSTTAGTIITVARQFVAVRYDVYVGLLRWDTSSIPDGATITAATLRVYQNAAASNADTRNLVGEWYEPGTIDTGDYTATSSSTAFSSALSGLSGAGWREFSLSNPDSNVSKTGYSGLRLHVDGGQPTGANSFTFQSFDNVSGNKPELVVTYTQTYTQSISGSVTPAGAVSRVTTKPVAGSVASSGAVSRITSKLLDGAISTAGALQTTLLKVLTLTGSLTPAGAITARTVYKGLAGAVTPAGSLVKQTAQTLAGTITPSGSLAKLVSQLLSGAIASSGTVTRVYAKILSGSISLAGSLVTRLLAIPPAARTLLILAQSRMLAVWRQARDLIIHSAHRRLDIDEENRTLDIDDEDRRLRILP